MAFALPSFNAAVVSAQTSGTPLQRMQANIDFQDVKSDIATKYMTKLPLEKFITEANIAKQALAEYGAGLRTKMDLDHKMKISEMNVKQNKRNALVDMLTGDDSNAGTQLIDLLDPRDEGIKQMNYLAGRRQHELNMMGGLHPQSALAGALTKLGQIPAPKTNAVIQQIKKTEQQSQPITLDLPQASNNLLDALNTLKQGQQTQKAK